MAIPDVGAALAAPAPQTPVSSGSRGKPAASAGRQSFASIVNDLSDESASSTSDARVAPRRDAGRTGGDAGGDRSPRGERSESVSRPSSHRTARPQAKTAGVPDANTSSAEIAEDRTADGVAEGGAPNKKQAADATGEATPQPDATVADDGAVPVVVASAAVQKPATVDAPEAATGQDPSATGPGHTFEASADSGASALLARAEARRSAATPTATARLSSTEDGAFSEEATPLAETLPSVAAGSTASTSATTTPFATAAAWHRERQNAAVDTQAGGSQRQGSAVDPARIATLSVRDALARALATGASDSDAPPPSGRPVVRTETASIKDPTTSDATPRTSGLIADGRLPATDAPAVTSGRVEPPQPQSEQVPATLAERVVESGDRGTADIEQGSAILAEAPADKAPRLDRIQANQPPAVAPAVDQQAPSAESSNATANATAREGASLAADTAPAPAELRAAQVDRVAVSSPVPHEPRSASTPEALSASLTAQRAQAVYGRAEAQKPLAEPAAADPSSQNSIAPTPGVERSAYQAPPTASTPQTPPNVARPAAPRAIDPRHQRGPATPAGVPTASVTTPSLTIATPSASAVSAAVSAQTGDEPSSQQDAAARSTRSAHQGGAAADAVADMPNLAPSFRQGTDAGALGTATPASSRAREASVAAPPPVAPKLTGTSAIAIAAFQAAAAAAAVDTELVTGSAQTPSARVLDQELPSQIVQAIRLRADNGNGQVHMRLNPDYLGEVSVDVRMNGASVVASVHASSAEVRDWLRTNEMQLRQTLADQGLHLQELVVSDEEPSEREGSGQRHQPSDEQAQERRARRPRETATFEVLL